jgi:Flp pilus assembly protein TadD
VPFYRFGETALSAGLYEEALAAFDRAAEIEPENNRGYNGAGIALDLLGRHGEAQNRYVTGMEHAPESVPLRNNLGLSLALAGDLEEAVSWLEAVADRDDANARTRQNLALVYGLSGNEDGARRAGLEDLSAAEVENNLAFYARLRQMPPEQRTKAIFGALQ